MDGIILERPSFLVLLDALQTEAVVGLDSQTLWASTLEEQQAQVQQGLEQLQNRGLLRVENGIHALHPDLVMLGTVVTLPELVFLTVRNTSEIGQQLFLHYQAQQFVVEQTFPSENLHRLASLPNPDFVIPRIDHILGMPADSVFQHVSTILSEQVFFEIQALMQQGTIDIAATHLQSSGLSAEGIALFVEAAQSPKLTATVAILQCQDKQVVDGRNMALIYHDNSTWLVHQKNPGVTTDLILETVNGAMISSLLRQWQTELLPSIKG